MTDDSRSRPRDRAAEKSNVVAMSIVAWAIALGAGGSLIWFKVPGVRDDFLRGYPSTTLLAWGAALLMIPVIIARMAYLFGKYQIVLRDREDDRTQTQRLQRSVSEWAKPKKSKWH